MALNFVTLSAGDQGIWVAHSSSHDYPVQSALASAMASGDSFLVGRPELIYPGTRQAMRLSVQTEGHRMPGGRNPTRPIRGRELEGGRRIGSTRFSPYPIPRVDSVC
ncbi:uncharacterized protein C11orf71 homolog [Fukomys damarensis]|uniref:Uncharacterized protein n=1 Tax=Fukomys damarensis TaxID=885580 RepID=A0A091E7J3_FUKDA|nr:uncharacterized protein C11orf71 homolog [Fukomys damarensis]KFO31116.1 hypothetical protein H920_07551 [Fukomys damarensis]